MTNPGTLPRTLLIYAILVPLALLLGYMLTSPADLRSLGLVTLLMLVLVTPLFLRFHQGLVLFAWSAQLVVPFFPGTPPIWMFAVAGSLSLSILNRILDRRNHFLRAPSITWSLLVLLAVVLVTAKIRGGIGLNVLSGGGSAGGKGYVFVLTAIAGYFALTAAQIPVARLGSSLKLFFLSGLTGALPHLVKQMGESFYFLFWIVPVGPAVTQYQEELSGTGLVRFGGLNVACAALVYYLLARHGVRGLFDWRRPHRGLLFLAAMAVGTTGGFRSILAGLLLLFVVQFVLEGLHRTRLLAVVLGTTVLALAILIPLGPRLPLAVQRSLSFLPIEVDPAARLEAQNSTEWRLAMWRALLPELPDYKFLGRGYRLSMTDLWIAEESQRRGLAASYEQMMIAGVYHNGPLSLYVPFGSFGVLAFLAFLGASLRALYRNFRYGSPALRQVNTFFLALFVTQIVLFIFVFGAFDSQLAIFTGTVGLSVALNGGVRRPGEPAPADTGR
jgi:hypothetical protein